MRTLPVSACLLVLVAAGLLGAAYAHASDDAPPPVPYGTQQAMKLKALVEAAPFMTPTDDEVRALMQERLRVCAAIFETEAERVDLGRQALGSLAEPTAELKRAWLALAATPEEQMPILKFVLQLAEHRERSAEALSSAGQVSSLESLEARRARLDAEIEWTQCQRAMSSASVK